MTTQVAQRFQTSDVLRMFPSFVWKAELRPEVHEQINNSIVRMLGEIGAPLADLRRSITHFSMWSRYSCWPKGPISQLKRVIVSDGTRVAMGSGLAEALQVLFGQGSSPSEEATGTPEAAIPGAREAFSRADQALRQGDWSTFGREWEQLKNLLEK